MTKVVLELLRRRREDRKDDWSRGGLMGPSIEETALRNAVASGYCSAIEDFLNIEFEEVEDLQHGQ